MTDSIEDTEAGQTDQRAPANSSNQQEEGSLDSNAGAAVDAPEAPTGSGREGSGGNGAAPADLASGKAGEGQDPPSDSSSADEVGTSEPTSTRPIAPSVEGAGAGREESSPPDSHPVDLDDGAPVRDGDQDIALVLANLDSRFEESQRLLGRQVDLVDRLHAENQRLRSGELRAATLPLIRDLLRLHDDIGRLANAGETDASQDLKVVQISLLDSLARAGVLDYTPAVGESFDPKLHSATGVVATEDEASDRTIAEVIRIGFHWEDGQVLRAADATVFKYRKPTDESGQAA
jgi:molecular chaperone GrpE (heat shock protein)